MFEKSPTSRLLLAAALVPAWACATSDDDRTSGDASPGQDASATQTPDGSADGLDAAVASEWTDFEAVPVDFDGDDIETPIVVDDGLSLYFTRFADDAELARSTRPSTEEAFGAPSDVTIPDAEGDQHTVEISNDGLALYYSEGVPGEIYEVTRPDTDAPWSEPVSVGVSGSFPTVSDDKLALYYLAQEDGVEASLERVTRFEAGQPWSTPEPVEISEPLNIYSSIDISGDELSILLTPHAGDDDGELLLGTRASAEQPFADFEAILPYDPRGTSYVSARFNEDETAIWTIAHDGGDELAVSHRDR